MGKLLEITVQKEALIYLEEYYKWRASGGRVWNKIEVRTRKKYGGKRADGLLVYKRRLIGGLFVASMEAKSYKTLGAITPIRDNWLWLKNSLYYATLIALGSGAVFMYQMIDNSLDSLLYIVGLWVFLLVVVAFVTKNRYFNRTMPVYKQILQYPGHEQWISISQDSYDLIPKHLRRDFVKVLKARGIGLLIVTKRKFVHRVHKPKRNRKWVGNFLQHYSLEEEIRKYLK